MSCGICICSNCKREVHQRGKIVNGKTTWIHCCDNTPICNNATPDYALSKSDIVDKYCGCDDIKF